MKYSLFGILFLCSVVLGETVRFNKHDFTYQISKEWEVEKRTNEEGDLTITLKRAPIVGKNKIEVIPTITIMLMKTFADSKNSDNDIMMFTQTCLVFHAPQEVRRDFAASKRRNTIKYHLPVPNSYAFNAPYKDDDNAKHICMYMTAFDPQKYGAFICIDATEEAFAKIEHEIKEFLNSISMDDK
jgi:hypothetical protein